MTTRGAGFRNIHIALPEELFEDLDGAADALDVNTGVYLTALIIGAARSGNADRHAMAGLDHVPHKSRMRARRPWQPENAGQPVGQIGTIPEAAAWCFGEWTMVRLGHPGPFRPADEGWYLEGPGVEDATHVGWTQKEAMDNAEPIIARWERQHPAS